MTDLYRKHFGDAIRTELLKSEYLPYAVTLGKIRSGRLVRRDDGSVRVLFVVLEKMGNYKILFDEFEENPTTIHQWASLHSVKN